MNEAEQVIFRHLSEQMKKVCSEAIDRLESKMTEAIMRLESDEVIFQMQADPNLIEFKNSRIKELIQDVMGSEKHIMNLSRAIAELKNSLFLAEVEKNKQIQMLRLKEEEFLDSFNDIEEKYNEYRRQVEAKALEQYKELEQVETMHAGCPLKISTLESKCSEYEGILKTMQGDMMLIKTRWEQRCREVQNDWKNKSKSDLQTVRKQWQQKMEALVNEYAKCAKDGKSLIVQADEQTLRQLRRQISELRSKLRETEHRMEEYKNSLDLTTKQASHFRELAQQTSKRESRIITETQSLEEKCQAQSRMIQQKNDQLKRMERQNTNYKREIEKLKIETEKLKIEIQKEQSLRRQVEEQQLKELEDIRDRVERESSTSLQKQNIELLAAKEAVRQRSLQLQQMEMEIQSMQKIQARLKQEINSKDQLIIQQETKINIDKMKIKNMKDKEKRLRKALESCKLPLQRLKNQNSLNKQQVKYDLEVYRRKLHSQILEIAQRTVSFKEKIEQKANQKLMSLLNEVQQTSRKQAATLEKANTENESLKNRIAEYQRVFEDRLIEIREDVKAKEGNAIKMSQQLRKAKETIEQLRQEKESMWQEFQKQLMKFKKQILKTIRLKKQSSSQQLFELVGEELKTKEREVDKLRNESRQKQDLLEELERKLQTARMREEEKVTEIEVLKQKSRVQEQTRKKLEKQLKDARLQMVCKQGVINELARVKKEKQNITRNMREDKERELEEIRAMIVKTYEVVGGKQEIPERGRKTK